MRRILAGIVSGAVGVAVFIVVITYLEPEGGRTTLLATVAATVGTYAAIDSLGLIPPPFDSDLQSIRHRDETSDDSERE